MPARNSSMELSSPSNADNGASTQRRSGRVVKPPKIYEAAVSLPSTKRKRVSEANTGLVDDSSEDHSDAESGPDEEERRERRRANRSKAQKSKVTPAKRAKVNGGISELAIRSAPAQPKTNTKRPRKAGKGAFAGAEDVDGLFAEVFAGTASMDDVAAGWLSRFNRVQTEALKEIINLIIRACGCTIEVSVDDIADPDNCASRLTDIQDEFQAQNIVDYPLIAKNGSTFRRSLTDFFRSLVRTIAASGILYEVEDLMDNIQSWVVAMSSSANRAFRHTATVVSLEIMSALCEVGHNAADSRAKTLRQLEGERKKTKSNKQRLESFKKQAEEHAKHGTDIDRFLRDWFDTVFVHRYRDINPKIRLDCISSLADWVLVYPNLFFEGQFIRYLGWLLSDSNPAPRHEVVKQLTRIYKQKDKIAGLRQFTERFRPRMVEMAVRDADPTIRASAVVLLDILRENGLLEPDDVDTVGKLVYDADSRVRAAVVDFFVANIDELFESKIEELGGLDALEEHLPAEKDDDFESPQGQWLRLKALAEILESYDAETEETPPNVQRRVGTANDVLFAAGLESRFSLALQALYPRLASTLSWETVAGYLLFDHTRTARKENQVVASFKAQCRPSELEELILLELLNVAVKTALTDVTDSSNAEKRTKQTKQQATEFKDRQEEAAQRLSNLIPRLLKKFGSTPSAVTAILRLERVLNLDKFQELRHESTTFANFLDEINRHFLAHQSQDVLSEARAALLHAKDDEELRDVMEGKEQALKEDIAHRLVTQCKGEKMGKRGSIDETLLGYISSSLLRVANLSSISDCTATLETARAPAQEKGRRKQRDTSPVVPLDLIIDAVGRGMPVTNLDSELNDLEDQVFQQACRCLFFYFLWKIQKFCAAPDSVKEADVNSLADKRDDLLVRLGTVIHARSLPDDVRVSAAALIVDLQTAFTQTTKAAIASDRNAPDMSELASKLSRGAQQQLLSVFSGLEKELARKTRRNLDAAPAEEDDEPEASDDEPEDPNEMADEIPEQAIDEEDNDFEKRKARAAEIRHHAALVAEERLCTFAGRLVLACLAGAFALGEGETNTSNRIQKRISRNSSKLGQNFKGVIAMLVDPARAMAGPGRKKAPAATKPQQKSQARIEVDDEDDENEAAVDEDDEEAVRRHEDGGDIDDDEPGNVANREEDEEEEESLLGD